MSVFVFNKDFAGIRTSGQEVNCRIDGSNVIVENIAKNRDEYTLRVRVL